MRLDKLRGYGPWLAFAVPFIFLFSIGYLVVVTALAVPNPGPAASVPGWFGVAIAFLILLWALMIVAGLVVAIDLEWIEHPRTNTAMTYVGLGGMAVATLGVLVFLLDGVVDFLGGGFAFFAVAFLIFAGFGVYLVVMNLVGLHAGLLGRVLPWIGLVAGALFLIAALLVVVGLPAGAGFGYIPGWILYLAWSFWLGFRLRGRAPAAVPAAAPA